LKQRRGGASFVQFLSDTQKLCYGLHTRQIQVAHADEWRESEGEWRLKRLKHNRKRETKNGDDFFIPIGRNSLKSPDSKK
jgi:hypothetical protein